MMAITDVRDLLTPINGMDLVATLNLTDEQSRDMESTIALVTEVLAGNPVGHGSDRTTEMSDTVAISIFYGTSKTETAPALESAIFDALENAGWYQTYTSGHTLDPASGQYAITKHFTKTKERF